MFGVGIATPLTLGHLRPHNPLLTKTPLIDPQCLPARLITTNMVQTATLRKLHLPMTSSSSLLFGETRDENTRGPEGFTPIERFFIAISVLFLAHALVTTSLAPLLVTVSSCAVMWLTHEEVWRNVQSRHQTLQDFILKDLKQRFSNAGSAIDGIIGSLESSSSDAEEGIDGSSSANLLSQRLKSALRACHIAESRCQAKLGAATGKNRTTESHSGTVPKNLIVAVLDDNSLVRMNVQRILHKDLEASPSSVVRGATYDECINFVNYLVDTQPDIAVFDENLDFDREGSLSGTRIAKKARELGYEGCMVRHSSETLAVAQDGSRTAKCDPLFDGTIEKTCQKSDFLLGICEAWRSYQGRLQCASNH